MIFNGVISAEKVSGLELLWENPNPASQFNPQTINLPTGYSAFIVEFKESTTSTSTLRAALYVPFSTTRRYIDIFVTTSTYWYYNNTGRYITSAIDGSVTFGDGYHGNTSDDSLSTNNSYAIPTAIYGLKFTI